MDSTLQRFARFALLLQATCVFSCRFSDDDPQFRHRSSVRRHRSAMGRHSGLRARCRHRCSTWWFTCKCHHTAVDYCRTCAAGCRNSRRTLTICCTKTYLVALNFMFLVRVSTALLYSGGLNGTVLRNHKPQV